MKVTLIFAILLYLFIPESQAANMLVQGRVFFGVTKVDPQDFNTAINNQGLKKIDGITNYGGEITFPKFGFLELGGRYTHRLIGASEENDNPNTEYNLDGKQDSLLLLARIPILKTSFLRLDIFGGFGGSNTTLKLKTATSNGELKKSEGEDWFSTPYSAYGASLGIGFKGVYLFAEAGIEQNKVDGFIESGTMSTTIKAIDLSGTYAMIGLLFDGVKAYSK